MTEPTRTLTDDIYDALGMPGTWWMGRDRLADHITLKLQSKYVSIASLQECDRMVAARDEKIEALKRNIDDIQTELQREREKLPVIVHKTKWREKPVRLDRNVLPAKPKAPKKK